MTALLIRDPSSWGSFPGFYLAGPPERLRLVDHPEDADRYSPDHAAQIEGMLNGLCGFVISREAI